MRVALVIPILASMVLGAAAPAAADGELAAELRRLTEDHLSAYDREDPEATLRTIHSSSPEYETTKKRLASQFPAQEVTVELVHFHYIGHCDEFAYARVKTKTVADGSGFTDNVVDTVALFHMENGAWKFWSDHVIGVELVE